MEWFRIETFAGKSYNFDSKTYKALDWKPALFHFYKKGAQRCFTMTASNDIIENGIKEIRFKSNSSFTMAIVHQNGLYRSDIMPPAVIQYRQFLI